MIPTRPQIVLSDETMPQVNRYLGVDVELLWPQTHQDLYDAPPPLNVDPTSPMEHTSSVPNSSAPMSQQIAPESQYDDGDVCHITPPPDSAQRAGDEFVDDSSCSLSLSHEHSFQDDPLLVNAQGEMLTPQFDASPVDQQHAQLQDHHNPPQQHSQQQLHTSTSPNEKPTSGKPTLQVQIDYPQDQSLDDIMEAHHHGVHVLNQLNTPAHAGEASIEVDNPNIAHPPHALNNKPTSLSIDLACTSPPPPGLPPLTPRTKQRLEDAAIAQLHLEQQKQKIQIERIVVRKPTLSLVAPYIIDRHGQYVQPIPNETSPGMHPPDQCGAATGGGSGGDLNEDEDVLSCSSSNSSLSQSHNYPLFLPTSTPDPRLLQRNAEREHKWIVMTKDWHNVKPAILKRRIRKGIPSSMRRVVWPLIMNLEEAQKEYPHRYYYSLLGQPVSEQCEVQIRKDLPRLMQDNVLFRSPEAGSRTVMCTGQAMLYNILKACSIHDPEVGYVQGMDSVAAPALLYFPEETAFWFLHQLLRGKKYMLRGIYLDGFPLARKYVWIHEQLVKKFLPNLYKVMKDQHIQHDGYAFRWYAMRYAQFPPDLALRILDIYLHEGDKILYRVALALLQAQEAVLLSDPDSLLERLMRIDTDNATRDELHRGDGGDFIINQALKIPLKTSQVEKLSKEYDKLLATNKLEH